LKKVSTLVLEGIKDGMANRYPQPEIDRVLKTMLKRRGRCNGYLWKIPQERGSSLQ
jgi:hypothetical protein